MHLLTTFVDCGFTHQKRFVTSNLSSSPQGDTHEAAIKHDPAWSSYAYGESDKNDALVSFITCFC